MFRSPTRILLLTGAALVAAAVVVLGWQVWQANRDLQRAVEHAQAVQVAAMARDSAGVDRELAAVQEATGSAVNRTSGLRWRVLSSLPLVGDDAEGFRDMAVVVDQLAADGVGPLVTAVDGLGGLVPTNGAIDADAARRIQQPVAQAQAAFEAAAAELDAIDASGFSGRVRLKYDIFDEQVSTAARALATLSTATKVLPEMLGGKGERHYLLVFQNNAEVRALGGLPGAVSYVGVDRGVLTIQKQSTGAVLGEVPEPVLPLTPAERFLYGPVVGTYFLNANMTPDAARAADLMKARWEQAYPGERVDGVILVDAVALSYLLDATGPIEVGGTELTGDNLVSELLHDVYLRLPDPTAQDAFFAKVARVAFERFTQGGIDPAGVIKAMAKAVEQSRVTVHSFDAGTQAALADTDIAGQSIADPSGSGPRIAVTVNDTTGAKMSYYLRSSVVIKASGCQDGQQEYVASAQFRSSAPLDAATSLPFAVTGGGQFDVPAGLQLITVRVFGPTGGEIGDVVWKGEKLQVQRVEQEGRPVMMTYVQLLPGERSQLSWRMHAPRGQTGDTSLFVTPSIEETDGSRTIASACGRG